MAAGTLKVGSLAPSRAEGAAVIVIALRGAVAAGMSALLGLGHKRSPDSLSLQFPRSFSTKKILEGSRSLARPGGVEFRRYRYEMPARHDALFRRG
jgi:hypothetical protein